MVAEVTWFLRKGDVTGHKQKDNELIMDKRDNQDRIVRPLFIQKSCNVVSLLQGL